MTTILRTIALIVFIPIAIISQSLAYVGCSLYKIAKFISEILKP